MEISLITDHKRIKFIYNTFMKRDFPGNELKPLASIIKMWKDNAYYCYEMTENNNVTGYVFSVKQSRAGRVNYLIDYLAVSGEYRNQGFGSMLLSRISFLVKNAGCVIVEVEDPDYADDEESELLRKRRIQFYLRNGFSETGITARLFGVQFRILELAGSVKHTKDEIKDIYESLYRYMVPGLMYKMNVKIF